MGVIGTNGATRIAHTRPHTDGVAVVRIHAIEGLRAWLAWGVVFYHLLNATNIDALFGVVERAESISAGAVKIFMIVSGFVITGLLLTRSEGWIPFITRRAFRLFPAYWIALALGAVAMLIRPDVFANVAWRFDPAFVADLAYHTANDKAVADAPIEQVLYHIGLLQGLPPPAYMPYSSSTILGPAWSLTVEWQFYLVAPFLVWMARTQARAVILVVAATLLLIWLNRGWQGDMIAPAALPNYLFLFVIGIFSRIALPYIPRHAGFAWAAAAAIAAIGIETGITPSIAIWLAFVVLIARASNGAPQNAKPGLLDRAFKAAFESRLATYLGDRSYSVYILHSPILVFAGYFVYPLYGASRIEAFLAMLIVVVPVILVSSDLMYRFVERPMIRAGARLANRMATAPNLPAKDTGTPVPPPEDHAAVFCLSARN
jgi:peptidoglycan/LPS O-acetylase OafA/YrhL